MKIMRKNSESNKKKNRIKKLLVFLFSLCFLFNCLNRSAYALPRVSDVENGAVTFEQPDSSTMNIYAPDKAVINFNSYDIAQNEAVHYIQPSSSAVVLNRVTGSGPSQIAGLLTANGSLFLVNPNGIHFSPTAQVQVNALVASTLDISTNNFIKGSYIFEHVKDGAYAQVLNEGAIKAGQVALLGSGVRNAGIITAVAGTVHLASGDKMTVTTDRMGLIHVEVNEATSGKVIDLETGEVVKDAVANSGTIEAHQVVMNAQTASDIFENAVNQTGVVKATTVVEENGVIRLVSNRDIAVAGNLEARGGEVSIVSGNDISVTGTLNTAGSTALEAARDIHILADVITEAGDLYMSADRNFDGVGSFLQDMATTIKTLVFGSITIQSSGESLLANIISCGDLIFKQGGAKAVYTQQPDSRVETGGSLMIDAGVTLKAGNSRYDVSGNWINLGVFNPGTSTVSLLTQTPVTVIGSNVFYNLYVSVPGKIVNFEPRQTQTIVGILTLKGEYGNLLKLESLSAPDQWEILALGPTDIAYCLVGNSRSIRGPPLKGYHSSSSGNLTNWDLDPFWTGQGPTSLWSDSDNWDTGTIPTAYDIVTFDGVTGLNPHKDSILDENFQGTIEKLTIDGYLGMITLRRDLTVTGDLTLASGTLSVIASEAKQSLTINIGGNWSNSGGHFEAGTSTVVFYDASKISTILGNNTFYNLTCLTPGKTIVFQANSLTTIQNTLTLDGSEDGYITLKSSVLAKGSEFGIYVNAVSDAEGHPYLDYLNVYYSIAYGPVIPILVNNEYIPAELNINWDATYTWTGTTSNLWNLAANWGGTLPLAGGDLVFPAGASNISTSNDFAADTSFKSITISGSGYTLAGNRITISSSMTDSVASGGNTISLDIIFAATRTITVTNAAETLTIGGTGIISGAGGVTKAGSGVLVLSGANTYTGTTTLSAGTLNFADGALGSTGNITFSNGTLQYATGNAQDISSRIKSSSKAIIIDTNGNDVIFAGVVDNSNGGGLTKSGAGALTLSAVNTFTGTVTLSSVTGSILNINNAQALGNAANTFVINGSTIDNTSGSAITLLNYPMTWNNYFIFTGTNDLNLGLGIITIAGGGPGRGANVVAGTLTINNVITSAIAYTFTKDGAGTMTLSGTNTFYGTIVVTAGTLNINNAQALGAATNTIRFNNGTIDNTSASAITLVDYNINMGGSAIPFTGTQSLNLGNGALSMLYGPRTITITVTANTLTLGGALNFATNQVVKAGTGTLVFSGSNASTGVTNLSAGTLVFSNGSLSTGNINFTGGTLQYASLNTQDISSLIKNGTSVINIDTNGNDVTFASVINNTNTSGLVKLGTGALSLSAANTYTGGTTINTGTLNFANTSLSGSGNIVFTGGTLQYASLNTQDISSRIKNSTSAVSIDTNGNNVTFASVVDDSNTAGLTKSGSGTLTLSAVNTYTGTTTVSAGTLACGINSSFASVSVVISSGATLDLAGYNLSAGGTSFSNNGTLKLTGNETVTTPTLNVGSTVEYSATSGTRAIKDWTYTNAIVKINGTGGTFTLPSALTCAGINIAAGTLQQGANTITVGASGISQSSGTFTGSSSAIGCTGNFSLTGGAFTSTSGTLTVGGNWANSGTFTHNSGTVTFNATATGKTIATGAQYFYNVIFNGSGGEWTLQDSFYQNSSGTTAFTAGTLNLNGKTYTATKSQTVTLGNGFTLNVGSGITSTNANMSLVVGTGSAITVSTGTVDANDLTVSGTGTFTCSGATTITVGGNVNITSSNWTPGNSTLNQFYSTRTLYSTQPLYNYQVGGTSSWAVTVNLGGDLTVQNNFSIIAGTGGARVFNASSYVVNVGGNWDASGGTFTCGTSTVTFNGAAAQTITGATTWYNLTINNTYASPDDTYDVDPTAVQTVTGTLTITDGQWTPYTGDDYNNVSIGANGIMKPDASASITVSGNYANAGTFTPNSGTVTFDAGTTGKTINPGASSFYNAVFNGIGGYWTETTNNITVTNNLTITNGTYDLAALDLAVSGNLLINGGQLDADNADCDVDINGNVTVTSGTLSAPAVADDTSFTAAGNWEVSGTGIFTPNSGRVVFDAGTTGKTIVTTSSGTDDFYDIKFNNVAGGWTASDALETTNFILTAGTFVAPATTLSIAGNFSNAGTFTHNSGTVTFNGASGTQTLNSGGTAAGNQFYNVTINNTGTKVQLVTNNLTQGAGGVLAFTQGTLDLNGRTWTLGANFVPAPTSAAVLDVSTNGGGAFTGASSYDITLSDADMTLTQGTGTLTCRDYSQTLGAHTLAGILNTRDFSHTGGTLICSGTSAINASGNVVITGAWTNTGNTITMSGASKTINASQALNNLTIADGASVSLLTNDLSVGGNLAIGQGASGSLDTNSRNLSVTGTTTINSGATFNLDGTSSTSALTIAGTLTISGALTLEDDTHTLSIIGNGGVKVFTGNDIDYNTNSVTLTNIDYDPDVILDEAGDAIVLGDSNCVFDSISIGVGSVISTFNAGAYDFALSGNFINTASGVFTSTGTTTFNGASDQTVTPGGTDTNHDFQNITHTGAGNFILGGAIDIDGTLTQNNASSDIDPSASNYAITAGNLTLTAGTINNSSRAGTWAISGNLTITTGTLKAPAVIAVAGNWSNAGTWTHNSGAVTFNGAADQTITTNAQPFYNLTLNNTGTSGSDNVILIGALDVNGLLTITDGDLDVSTNDPNVNIAGGMTVGANGSIDLSAYAGTWTYDGTGALTDNRVTKGDLGAFTIDGTAAVLTLGSNIKAASITVGADDTLNLGAGSYTLELTGTGTPLTITTGGTFNKGTGSTVNYTGSGTATNVTTVAYNNLTFTPTSATTYSLTGDLTGANAIAGNLTINSNATLDTNSKSITVGGTTVINGVLLLDGASAASSLTISNTLTNSGTFTLENDTNLLSIIGSGAVRTFTGNDIDYNTNSVTLTSIDYDPDVSLDEAGDAIVLGDSNCVFDAISIGVGSVASTFNAGAYDFTLSGSFTNTATGIFTSTGTATFNAATDQTVTPGGTDANHDFNNVTHTGAGNFILGGNIDIDGTLTQNNASSDIDPSASNYAITAGNLTLTNGTINVNSRTGTWNISGNLAITSGTLKAPTTINVGGNWSNSGVFIRNSSTVNLTASTASTISGNTTFNNFSCVVAGKTLYFGVGDTQTIAGTLTLTGVSGNLLILRSTFTPTQWRIDSQGTRNISYVDVKDSNNINASAIVPINSISSGNNINWTFGKDFSGTVYSDKGITPVGAGKTVAVAVNGAAASKTAVTNSNGQYTLSGVDIADGDVVIIYLDGETEKGSTVSVVAKENFSGFDIYQNTIIVRHDYTTGYTTNANLATADNGDADIKYSVSSGNLTVDAGQELFVWSGDTYQPGGNVTTTHIDIDGTLTAGSYTFTISGNWSNSGTFTYNTSTVTFNDGSRASVISGSTTFYNLTSTTPAKSLTFTRGTTQTVKERITLTGAAANPMVINDTGAGVIPQLAVQSGAVQAITNVRVTNNDASGGIKLIAQGAGSTLSGDTPNWALGSAGSRFRWNGSVSSDWGNSLNWDLGLIPSPTDTITIPPGVPHQPKLDIPTTVKTLEVDAGETFNTGNQAFSVLDHFVLDGTLDAGISTVTVDGNMTTSGNGAIQGTSPTLAVSGYIGTKDAPLDLSVTGTAVISAASMSGMVSVSINGTGQIDYSASIPGFVYVNGQVDDKVGQSQIRSILQTGTSRMYAAPVSSSGFNSPSGFVPAPAVLAGAPFAPVMVPVATPVIGASLMPVPVASSVIESPVALVGAVSPVIEPSVEQQTGMLQPSSSETAEKIAAAPDQFAGVSSSLTTPPVLTQEGFSDISSQAVLPPERPPVSFEGAEIKSSVVAQPVFEGVQSSVYVSPLVSTSAFQGAVSSDHLTQPVSLSSFEGVDSKSTIVQQPSFEGVNMETVLPQPIVFEALLKETIISVALPEAVNRESFKVIVPEANLPNSVSFDGIASEISLPKDSQDMFMGIKLEAALIKPVAQEVFKGTTLQARLSNPISFDGINGEAAFPQPLMKPSFQEVSAGAELPPAVSVNKVAFEKARTEATLPIPVNPHVFGDITGEMKVKVVFPGGQQIMPVHGIGVPLGAEKPLLEPSVKVKEKD